MIIFMYEATSLQQYEWYFPYAGIRSQQHLMLGSTMRCSVTPPFDKAIELDWYYPLCLSYDTSPIGQIAPCDSSTTGSWHPRLLHILTL